MIDHVGPQDQAGHISDVERSMIDHVGPQDQAGHISEVEEHDRPCWTPRSSWV